MAFVTGTDAKAGETKGWEFAVGSGILGWVLDAFDFFVVVFLFDTLAEHFHVSKASVVPTSSRSWGTTDRTRCPSPE